MSNKKGSSSKNAVYDDTDEYGYSASNPRHQESYWEDRADPRFGYAGSYKGMRFSSNCAKVIDRQIAANHHERTSAQQAAQTNVQSKK